MKTRPIRGIDLCCGVGGMSLGFQQAGLKVEASIDSDSVNVESHKRNFPNCKTILASLEDNGAWVGPLRTVKSRGVDVVFGGPPCQGFSIIGKRRPCDDRNNVLIEFARAATRLAPQAIVVENVRGLLVGAARSFLDQYEDILRKAGYTCCSPWLLDACNYGVPQIRKRVFLVAVRNGIQEPHCPEHSPDRPTVWDAIKDLDFLGTTMIGDDGIYRGPLGPASTYAMNLRRPVSGSDNLHILTSCHQARHSEVVMRRIENTPEGKQEAISRFHRLKADSCSITLRAGTGPENGSFMAARPFHPTQPRCITVREAARIHGYPDDFSFHGTRWRGFRQVGNSVPPPLARSVAKAVIAVLKTG